MFKHGLHVPQYYIFIHEKIIVQETKNIFPQAHTSCAWIILI